MPKTIQKKKAAQEFCFLVLATPTELVTKYFTTVTGSIDLQRAVPFMTIFLSS